MMAAIDGGAKDSVYVMTVEDGRHCGHGRADGTTMYSRGYVGAIVDGGVRDVAHSSALDFRFMPWAGAIDSVATTNSAAQMFR